MNEELLPLQCSRAYMLHGLAIHNIMNVGITNKEIIIANSSELTNVNFKRKTTARKKYLETDLFITISCLNFGIEKKNGLLKQYSLIEDDRMCKNKRRN